jgi:hypothetical protein
MTNQSTNINGFQLFTSSVYTIEKPEFLNITRKVSKKFIDKRKEVEELNPNFPVYMTENMFNDPELLDFGKFISQTAWEILNDQGYAMQFFQTYFTEMWCQEHHKMSLMERHIHGSGAILSGFYFLNCPSEARVIFHDPRDAKVITSLPEKDPNQATSASNMIHFNATNGLLVFSNSWLPHSFNKNTEDIPLTFIHFNIAVDTISQEPMVEIV